jgi:two-component system, OmpR family, phosphate regulon sensor histidine kinase PhoR
MLKNPTPQQVSFYSALLTSFTIFVTVLVLNFSDETFFPALSLIILPVLSFLVCYFLVKYLIETFIYRRIKIIYKKITEAKKADNQNLIDPDSLDDVEKEVETWAANKNKQIANLEELEEYRRNYIGNVSHELKTPIFNIQGFLHTLIDGGINDPTINISYLQKAARNLERLTSIVEDLETISKLESGQMALDIQVFDIHVLAEEVFEDLELKAKERNIKLSFKEGAGQGYRVKADKNTIRQVLNNLINNSIKYGKKGGQTKVSFYDMDKIVLVEISDNGIGISRHHLKHLFDRFYRVDKGRSRDVGGTGLGLSIVKHIIEAHNQSVHVRSTEGVGSTFGFTLEKVKG